jgi:5-methylcytosine-specific restriction endonuclease McrA
MKRTLLRRRGRRAKREALELARLRGAVLFRASHRCERCHRTAYQLDVHHLLPRSRGGGHTEDNAAALCRPCHIKVHAHTADDWKEWVL